MMKHLFSIMFALAFFSGYGQTVLGKWKTIDDNSGEARSIVEIFENSGKVYGKIVKLFPQPNEDPDPICDKCDTEDPRFKMKVIGMEIIRDLKKQGQEHAGGDILDPENGKVYRARIWIEGKELKVRGYWGPFYRTQTWQRAE
ncbi:MAG TPA: DUF2147 domain-containing protein [Cyclobacteriaceae bacterium]|nr:DUF2147 domain-containing protein [Cyclobacteriaceae bacterium]